MSGKKAAGTGAKATPASTAPKAPTAPTAGAKATPSTTQKEIEDATKNAIASQTNATAQTQEGAKVIDPNASTSAGENGQSSSTVIPQTGTGNASNEPEPKTEGYIKEFNRSVELFGSMPLDSLTEQELREKNDAEVARQRAVPVAPMSEAHQQEIVRAFGLFGVGAIALQSATFEELKATNDAKQKELDGAANVTQNTNQISNDAIKANEDALGGEFVADDNHVIAEKNGEKKRFTKQTWKLMQDAPDQWKLVPQTPPEVQNLNK